MRLMSYNVQTGTPTPTRAAQMLNNILTFDADIVGTQEVNARWLCIFKGTGILDKYEYVGNPRGKEDDVSNGNEYSGILFKKVLHALKELVLYAVEGVFLKTLCVRLKGHVR